MNKIIVDFIKKSIEEDIGIGDFTSIACVKKTASGKAQLITKEACKIAGIEMAKNIYEFYDNTLIFNPLVKDGQNVKKGDVMFTIYGRQQSILSTERLILNCMQRMSGIATKTQKLIEKIKDLDTIILDTRKTCPSIRFLDKEAVKIGGAHNHRYGLFDAMMIKDNHIDFSGGIKKAITNCTNYIRKHKLTNMKIIIEVRNMHELNQVLEHGKIDRILLDNFNISKTKKAVQIINNRYPIESSGSITIHNVRDYALCGVNYISIGHLTHSIKSIDLSMLCI
tara:strand:+ start:3846 stop:4688 length:843 start_codon:yes stop_codon:yes gene_type:complete